MKKEQEKHPTFSIKTNCNKEVFNNVYGIDKQTNTPLSQPTSKAFSAHHTASIPYSHWDWA